MGIKTIEFVICNGVISVYGIVYKKWRKRCLEICVAR